MKNAIIDLWSGNIAPCEHCGSHDPELNQLICLMERNHDALCKYLTASQKDTLQKYIDCSEEYQQRMLELAFCEGFSLGSRLITEALL